MRTRNKMLYLLLGAALSIPLGLWAQDWYEASGAPANRSTISSAALRSEFAAIESDIADKLPTLTGNAGKIIVVNAGATALEPATSGVSVAQGGTGATTLTGLLQGNGTSAVTTVTNSSTAGAVLRVIGTNTYGFGQLNLTNSNAIIGDLPDANLSDNVPLATSGTFTASFDTGCSTTPTVTYDYQKVGNIVTVVPVSESGLPCTGDNSAMITTGTPVPAAIRPIANQATPLANGFLNAATDGNGSWQVQSTGNVALYFCAAAVACTTGTWTSSGSRDAPIGVPLTYMLGNP